MKAISLKLPDPLFNDLVQRAHASASTQSDIIRLALVAYLKSDPAVEPASCAQQASRWIGMVAGAEDLSTNPEHLRGFGR